MEAEVHLLLKASKSAIASQTAGVLRNLCEKHKLTVACTGKRGGNIKKDYVEAILLFVSILTY